jgi:hypothetical protein
VACASSYKEPPFVPLITLIDIDSQDIAAENGALVPMSDRFNAALAERYLWAGQERTAILAAANDPNVASSPQLLHELQLRQEAYTLRIALSSALMSHATKGIETLVKS